MTHYIFKESLKRTHLQPQDWIYNNLFQCYYSFYKIERERYISCWSLKSYLFNKFVASFLPIAIPKSAKAEMSSSKSTLPENKKWEHWKCYFTYVIFFSKSFSHSSVIGGHIIIKLIWDHLRSEKNFFFQKEYFQKKF